MILFFGYGDDRALVLAIEAAVELGVDHVLVDQRQAAFFDFLLRVDECGVGGSLHRQGSVMPLAEMKAVYARPLCPVPTQDERAGERARVLHDGMVAWLDVAEIRVVNRPWAMQSNASKPFQAQAISDAGLEVPATLVTSDPGQALWFWREHRDVVFKSTSGIRSIVRRLDETTVRNLHRLRTLPAQFQALVPGVDLRVHVVGQRVFATEVRSDATDYRYAGQEGLKATLAPIDLPEEVAARCLALAAQLELPFCGIDLRRRPDDTYVCFEANPMPGYSYYEDQTGQRIGRALVEYLAGCEVS